MKQGKVRNIYDEGDTLLLVSTDRLSAFDRAICSIPEKGVVLNKLSAWWFEQTHSIIANHFLAITAPNAMRVKKCAVFPIEVIVRGYITGSTNTSLWTLYQQGERVIWDATLPEGLVKNQKLPQAIITPTTKAVDHDRPLQPGDIQTIRGLTPSLWQRIEEAALALYHFGAAIAEKKGLILADTKYEFGLDNDGVLCLVDELHTPDSSRYWAHADWEQALAEQREVASYDKEIIRLWYRQQGDPYHMEHLPPPPPALIQAVHDRYVALYQKITGAESCVAS